MFFNSADEKLLDRYCLRYTEYKLNLTRKICSETKYESFFIGCNYSCVSVLGPQLWRKYDKPFIKDIANEIHKQGRLLHIHFHGKSMPVLDDLAELGVDCICPFERSPGGDVDTIEDLTKVRKTLDGRTTFNGNIHTVNTLIFGKPEQARSEVKDVKQAFAGSPRLIIGTGDQVCAGTKEDVLYAMIDEAKKPTGITR
jgi:uroporphyrinogen-III decarboxylase